MAQNLKASKNKLREPPPSLFLGPPSQNASQLSLAGGPGNSGVGSTLQPVTSHATIGTMASVVASRIPLSRQQSKRLGIAEVTPTTRPQTEGQKAADRTDALWAQMQSTLEEVELTAVNGMHVFGPCHTEALEGLRRAQIQLAEAWARSEAEDESNALEREGNALRGSYEASHGGSDFEGPRSSRPGSAGGGAAAEASRLDEETEQDIKLARSRREANDRYFQQVNKGVTDVVDKLEKVAAAMQKVQKQSKDIWDDSDASLNTEATQG